MIVIKTAINAKSMSFNKRIKTVLSKPAESKMRPTAADNFAKTPICDGKTKTMPAITMTMVALNKSKNTEIHLSVSAEITE